MFVVYGVGIRALRVWALVCFFFFFFWGGGGGAGWGIGAWDLGFRAFRGRKVQGFLGSGFRFWVLMATLAKAPLMFNEALLITQTKGVCDGVCDGSLGFCWFGGEGLVRVAECS